MAQNLSQARIDQWLWACRIFKTRSLAAENCRRGRVMVNGAAAKPSRTIKTGDSVTVRSFAVSRSFEVKAPAVKRVSAKLSADLVEETTSPEDLKKLEMMRKDPVSVIFGIRDRGAGRPTKKERRALLDFKNGEKGEL